MDDLDFTEDEIREQLEKLGYTDVSETRLKEFKRDLEKLVQHERSKNSSCSTGTTITNESSSSTDMDRRKPLYDHYRQPLDNAANIYKPLVNSSSYEHTIYGKENITEPVYQDKATLSRIRDSGSMYPNITGLRNHREETASDQSIGSIDTTLDTTTSSEHRMIKRKVVRKRDGHAVYEESLIDSEADEVNSMQDAMERLRIPEYRREHQLRTVPHMTYKRPTSVQSEPCYRLPDDYEGPKALIRPMTADPHTRAIKKNDPVSRYQQYRHSWNLQKAPGERSHKALRWSVREHMLYHDEVVQKKQHKVAAPNSYVIPSDKKRKGLRWQIRQDMAQGVVPPSVFE